ncbi:MAG TPA: hypothetical protein VFZ48_00055 [Candidatus Saccharimonadales bacterium]
MDPQMSHSLMQGLQAAIAQGHPRVDRAQREKAVRELIEQLTAAIAKGDTPAIVTDTKGSYNINRLEIKPNGDVRPKGIL